LLNSLLHLSLPQGDVVRSLDAQDRRTRLFELVARIVEESAKGRRLVLFVEDVHWMDESSLALASHLAGRLRTTRVLLLLTSRPAGAADELDGARMRRMVLAELTESESLAMVRLALGVADLPEEVGEEIYAKTKGNPLFLEEVVHSLQEPGVLDRILGATSVTRAAELAALEIPDRVQGLLMSRIDRLLPDTREVLKAGSVAGRSFDVALLVGIDDELLRDVSIELALDELIDSSLVVPGEDGDSRGVSFRHALVQDVAYESMPFARRRDLHGRVGRYLEATSETPDHGLLVHHYQIAGEKVLARVHAVRASEASAAVYANREAVDYLGVALASITGCTPGDAHVRSRLEELMSDSLERLGRYDEAVDALLRARRRWASQAVRRAVDSTLDGILPVNDPRARDSLLCWKIAVSVERGTSDYRRALRWLAKGKAALPSPDDGLAGRLLVTQGGLLSRLGRFVEAAEVGQAAVELTGRGGDVALRAYALTLLGYAYSGLGRLAEALECDATALALYEQAGDLSGQAMSHANLANSYLLNGDLRAALEQNETALALYTRIGNVGGAVMQRVNVGGVLTQIGDAETAVEQLEKALKLRDRPEVSPYAVAFALVYLCEARILIDDLDRAQADLLEGQKILVALDAQADLLDAGVIEAELRVAGQDLTAAETCCRTVLKQAESLGAEVGAAKALCLLGQVQVAQGDPDAAVATLEAALSIAERIGADYERGQALAALAEAETACSFREDSCAAKLDQAIDLFDKMGAEHDLKKALETRGRLGLSAPDEAGERAAVTAEGAV
jgi:tetratricopeptide (TPR) repeat protein